MDVADSIVASFEVLYVLRGVAVHGIHEVWLYLASLKFCPSVVLVRASEVAYYRPFVCAYLDGFLVVKRLPSSWPYDGGTLPVL